MTFIGFIQGIGNLLSQPGGLDEIKRLAVDSFRERLALNVLHHDEAARTLVADLEDRADVRMIQFRGGLSFS
jgi:hypothetical protein